MKTIDLTKEDFRKIHNDINGNPRYILHYLDIANDYKKAVYIANCFEGRKYNTKNHPYCVVFTSYNLYDLCAKLNQVDPNN